MKIVEPRSLLNKEISKIQASPELLETFNQIKELMDERCPDYNLLDIFYAGYILANPTVKENFKLVRKKKIKYDTRVSNILWRRN